jgi:hypothetical protein
MIVDRWASGNTSGWQLYWRGTGTSLAFYVGTATNPILQDPSTSNIITGEWKHVAVVRLGSVAQLFVNGISVQSVTFTTNLTNTLPLTVGCQLSTLTNPFEGYIKDLRITKGVARYTTTFTPPTSTFETR